MHQLFASNGTDRCCLCGASGAPTGEHKVKASAIRSMFPGELMVIGSFDGKAPPRHAQSDRSKAFHFRSRVCGECNSTRTQPADIEFSSFDESARGRMASGASPETLLEELHHTAGGSAHVGVCRYLAKLLACHVADVGGRRTLPLTDFAIGRSDDNPVGFELDEDPRYRFWLEGSGDPAFAHHGGLGILVSRSTALLTDVWSTLTHSPLRYSFSIGFDPDVATELSAFDPAFHARCVAASSAAAQAGG